MIPKDNKKTIVVYTLEPWNHALTYLRYRAPAECLGWEVIQGREEGVVHIDPIREADIVLIQRVFPHWREPYRKVLEEARSRQKPVIYEIDDLLIALPSEHPCVEWYLPALEDILLGAIEADRVVVSSELLLEIFSIFNSDIKLWPAYLPDTHWKLGDTDTATENRVRIGYMGGRTHIPDLDSISPVLNRIGEEWGDKVEFHFWGCKPSEEIIGNVIVHYLEEKIDYREFSAEFSQAQADIWLAPLQDSIFNRCKSSIKYWEYAAVGGVGIFSNLEPYQRVIKNGQNGFLASHQLEWFDALSKLVANPALRAVIAREAKKTLEKHGRLSLHLGEWKEIYTTARSKKQLANPQSSLERTLRRFAEQLRDRSEKKEETIRELNEEINKCNSYAQQLELRSQHLDAILNSRSWRLIQLIGKIRGFLSGRHK